MRYLAWFALPFCAAAFLSCKLPVWQFVWPLAGLCSFALVPVLLARGRHTRRLVLLSVGACLGFLWFGGYTAAVVQPAQDCDGLESGFTAEVNAYPEETPYGVSVSLRMESGSAQGMVIQTYLDRYYIGLKPGDRITGTAYFSASVRNGEEDGSRNTARGIFLVASAEVYASYSSPRVPLRYLPAKLGHELKATVNTLFSGEEAALLQGLLTGDKSGLSDALYTGFRRSGMAHLLAVSGLHVGFLSGILYLLPGQKRRRALIAIPVMVCFALMTGGQPSVWRAVVMASLLLLAPLCGRESDAPTSLAFALLLLLLQNPYAAESVGLQLSFAAVAGLVSFQSRMYHWMMRPFAGWKRSDSLHRRVALRVAGVLAAGISTACAANVFTLPLAAYYFQTVSLLGPLSNLLCIWAASLAFGLGMCACVLFRLCPPLGELLALPEGWLLNYLIRLAEGLGRGNFAALRLDNLYLRVWLLALMALVALVIALKPLRRRPVLPMASAAALLALALTFRMISLTAPPLCVSVLDVDQGACTVFSSGGTFAAVDCGGYDAGNRLADYVQSGGADRLSLLVLTHFDSDHVNGVEQLLARIEVEAIALPEAEDDTGNREKILSLAEEHSCDIFRVDASAVFAFGEAEMTLFPPVTEAGENAACVSVLCSCQEHNVLITGDLGREQEELLLEREALPRLDLLVVGHHGSATSTGAKLLARLSPKYAVISVGENQYGFPAREVLDRLEDYHCEIYRTDENGTVTIRCR